jgi:DNA mismatch endonuclease (patch repair protein)
MYFPRLRLAVFVHGCFWHRCPTCNLPQPKANADFWQAKFEQNVDRDRRVAALLDELSVEALVIWEHEIRPDPAPRAEALAAAVVARRQSSRKGRVGSAAR